MNSFQQSGVAQVETLAADPELEAEQCHRLVELRLVRQPEAVRAALQSVAEVARGSSNLLYPMKNALAQRATIGEVSDALRGVFGTFDRSD